MSFNFQEALTTGAEQAQIKEDNSKIINDILKDFCDNIIKFTGIELEIKLTYEFKGQKFNAPVSILYSALAEFSTKESQKTGYIIWSLKHPKTSNNVTLFSVKEGKSGFPVQFKTSANSTTCDSKEEIIEMLQDLASDSDLHLKLKALA